MEKQMPKAEKRTEKRNNDDPKIRQPGATESVSCSKRAESLRLKGNGIFKQACDDSFSPCVRRSRLERAQQFYNDALGQSQSEDDKASCYKNLGAARMLLYKVELELLLSEKSSGSSGGEKQLCLAKFHLRNSIDFYVRALCHGTRARKAQEWLHNLQSALLNGIEWTVEESKKLSSPPELPLLRSLCQAFVDSVDKYPAVQCEAAIVAHKVLSEALLQQGIKELCKDDADGENFDSRRYANCLKFVHACYQPLSMADRLFSIIQPGTKLRQEMKDLEEQVQLHQNICQSVQARIEGDRLLASALHENEEMNVDLAWDAMDSYKQATLLTRERDVENEAIANSRMGRVCTEVFKNREKAHGYHFQAVRLALSIVNICPRITAADWYVCSNKMVNEYQEKIVNEEAKMHDLKRAPVMLKLEDKLQALAKKACESTESLLKYIYKEHPHPDTTKQLGPLSTQKVVLNTLKKALVHYHPDTNMKYGEEWVVLCEEIAKYLNRKYEVYKVTD